MKHILLFTLLFSTPVFALPLCAQDDSTKVRELEELVITATRNERTMGALPMPVTLVQTPMIKTMGSVRLNDVLTEQTGLVVVPQVNGMGNGIQIQGFNPDYTLILVDGEPLIGRFTGSLELSRLTVGNIKQIEIVKGPSSSLYGSEALAGVINIITDKPTGNTAKFSTRYATNNTLDVNATAGLAGKNWSASVFGNRFSTDGYDLSPDVFGKTVSPFRNYTVGSRFNWKVSPRTEVSLGGRFFTEIQDYNFDVTTKRDTIRTYGNGSVNDWNFNPVVTHRFSNKLKVVGRYYSSGYRTDTELRLQADGSLNSQDNFNQNFSRYELNGEYFFNEANITTVGAGIVDENVLTNRYANGNSLHQRTRYIFAQHEWNDWRPLNIIGGLRYDQNLSYGSQLSPKLAVRYEVHPKLSFKASVGVGFKAPDFRQLYLNFFNAAAAYTVLGSEVVSSIVHNLDQQGLIATYNFDPSQIGNLNAERSLSFNLGAKAQLAQKLWWDVNLFRNTVDNLIEFQQIAVTTSSQNIYSYRNISRVLMQGVETDLSYALSRKISFSLGYQLLYAKDRNVMDQVDKGEVFWRDPATLQTKRLRQSEYFGLYNRSRHTGNFKVFYKDTKGLEASLRVIYRGRFGVGNAQGNIQGEVIPSSDMNSNGLLDRFDRFVPGYALVNLSVARTINDLRFQLGVDNLFDYTDPLYIPNVPGRLIYGSVSLSLLGNSKNQ
ncbi:MAG: TonB-dependent receptor plug domain-containing protein [Cytophagales bacterium]